MATTSSPYDGTTWSITAPSSDALLGNAYQEIFDLRKGIAIRINKEHETLATSSAGGVHKQGSARAFFQDAAPTTQIDGTAWDSGDLGSLWFDSNSTIDNVLSVLTASATIGTWTPVSTEIIATMLAANRQFGINLGITGTLTVTGESTFNAHANLGDGVDLVGSATSDITINTDKFTVAGATGNTVVGGTLDVTGAAEITGIATLADESITKTTAAPTADAQIANKKYVDDNVGSANYTPTSYAGEESVTFPNGLIFKHGVQAFSGQTATVTFDAAFTTLISASVTGLHATNEGTCVLSSVAITGLVAKTNGSLTSIHWQAWGK